MKNKIKIDQVIELPEVVKTSLGVTVLHRKITYNDLVAVEIFFPGGLSWETEKISGVTSLLFRMLLRGTRRKSSQAWNLELEKCGANISWSVANDYTSVSLQMPVNKTVKTLNLLAEMLTEPLLAEETLIMEKKMQQQQIKNNLDQPLYKLISALKKTIYNSHPYSLNPEGELLVIEKLAIKNLKEQLKKIIQPERIVVSVVGKINPETITKWIKKTFNDLPKSLTFPKIPPPELISRNKRKIIYDDSQSIWCLKSFSAVPINHPDRFPLKIMNTILGQSMDSRLFNTLREKEGLVYQVGSFLESATLAGNLTLYWATGPQTQKRVLQLIRREVAKICQTQPPEEELNRAKQYLIGRAIMGWESNRGQASRMAFCYYMGLGIKHLNHYFTLLNKVTAADVKRVAQSYLHNSTMIALYPRKQP